MIVKIREIIRDCITFGMHFIYTRIYQMNIDKSAKLSFGAKLDKSNPKGVHIGEESFIASGAVILLTGIYDGKMWKGFANGEWYLVWFAPDKDPDKARIEKRKILIA